VSDYLTATTGACQIVPNTAILTRSYDQLAQFGPPPHDLTHDSNGFEQLAPPFFDSEHLYQNVLESTFPFNG